MITKRALDVVVGTTFLVASSPVLAAVAIAIKLDDHGPVIFRQTRVGRHGVPFELLKFRTMVVGAEDRRDELQLDNERDGPLFKINADPRITRVGRLLRETNLDELPQLLNVLAGTMSIVGPRPALPIEVADFPAVLRAREQVRPGITGPWQLQAGTDPSFAAYQRLDLEYVENWTVRMDLRLIAATIKQATSRLLARTRRSR
ncbi:MAG TPA: sugar transferase [Ilumatobacteraceae bacterium]